jgi:hypothetical protein
MSQIRRQRHIGDKESRFKRMLTLMRSDCHSYVLINGPATLFAALLRFPLIGDLSNPENSTSLPDCRETRYARIKPNRGSSNPTKNKGSSGVSQTKRRVKPAREIKSVC